MKWSAVAVTLAPYDEPKWLWKTLRQRQWHEIFYGEIGSMKLPTDERFGGGIVLLVKQ
jgi:hypothetical protein